MTKVIGIICITLMLWGAIHIENQRKACIKYDQIFKRYENEACL